MFLVRKGPLGVFPVISQTIAATPSLLSLKVAYRNPKTGLARGYRRKKQLASEAYRAIGGIAPNSIANRAILYSGTLSFSSVRVALPPKEAKFEGEI